MEQFRLWGTIINALAVVVGSAIGLLLKRLMGDTAKNEKSKALSDHIFQCLALCVLVIGISGATKEADFLIVIISVTIGSVLGHLMRLDAGINWLGDRLQALVHNRLGNVAQGFVSASLLLCVGSMTIVGALNSGLYCDHSVQYTKAVLDFVTVVVLGSSMGIGVMFSAAFVFIFQGSITLLAQWISPFLTENVVGCMSVIGSILIIALGLNMLKAVKLKIMNFMPAMFLPILIVPLADWIASWF